MSKCIINSCNSRRNWKSTISYFRIPAKITNQCDKTKELSSLRRLKWFEIINREDVNEHTANPSTVVCGLHFVSGKPAKLFDVSNPDWVPTLRLDDENEKVTVKDDSLQNIKMKLHSSFDINIPQSSQHKSPNCSAVVPLELVHTQTFMSDKENIESDCEPIINWQNSTAVPLDCETFILPISMDVCTTTMDYSPSISDHSTRFCFGSMSSKDISTSTTDSSVSTKNISTSTTDGSVSTKDISTSTTAGSVSTKDISTSTKDGSVSTTTNTDPYNYKHSIECQTELSMCDILALENDNLCLREELYTLKSKRTANFI